MTALPILLTLLVCPAHQPLCPAPTVYPPRIIEVVGGCGGAEARRWLDAWRTRHWWASVSAECREGRSA